MINRELAGGLAMLAFAALYALSASSLSMTSSLGIGSGLFPMMLAGLLALLGLIVALSGLKAGRRRAPAPASDEEEASAGKPYRALILVAAAPIVAALLVVPLGFAPALALAVFLSALASRETSVLEAVMVSLIMVLFCVALFRWALELPITLFGPFFPLV